MTYILVINAGSSSLKYQLIDIDEEKIIAKGICERIGIAKSVLCYKPENGEQFEAEKPMKTHEDAIKLVLDVLTDKKIGVIEDMSCISAVGHRVLHGGEKYSAPVLIDDQVLEAIEECIPLGPLHNPANLMGIRGCMAAMPGVPMVAVFDTAWGQTMPKKAYMYALPYEAYTEHKVRRYGFHGTSHRYVSGRAIKKLEALGMKKEDTRVITCHLGNGSSLSAVKGGKCVDTSMGLTPLEGVPMGTRCGSIDPAIMPYLMGRTGMSAQEMDTYMNKKSGMLGLSGVSSDFRDLAAATKAGNERAALARELFCYKVKQYIGAYAASLGGVDAIVLTAGVGENDPFIREMILEGLEYLGMDMDYDYNKSCPRGKEVEISKPTSKVHVYVIPTDEEMTIAHDTAALAL
ncbi:Acetate kinase [bioreactor metagenome]|uniref:Acetate kinase n=1 Tax=bioreactor metagenome TaxID=1076179 RepID=A0A644YDP3_9ZZZZ